MLQPGGMLRETRILPSIGASRGDRLRALRGGSDLFSNLFCFFRIEIHGYLGALGLDIDANHPGIGRTTVVMSLISLICLQL